MRILTLLIAALSVTVSAAEPPPELTLYVYDSFFQGAPREKLRKAIEAATRHRVNWVVVGDSGQLVSRHRLDLKRGKAKAHLLIGVDQTTFAQLEDAASEVTEAAVPALKRVEKRFRFSPKFVPFNYGVLALVVDTQALGKEHWPEKWQDLLKPALRKKLLLQDPRTSTPGLGFLLGSRAALGADFEPFWKKLKDQWLTLSPGWSQAYGLFQKAEAPLVWSYTTSQAYHQLATPPTNRYQAIVFQDGNPVQIEGIIVPKDMPGQEPARRAAMKALEVLLSETVQAEIPRAQWMIPVRSGVPVPWKGLLPPIPEPRRLLETVVSRQEQEVALKLWSQAIR